MTVTALDAYRPTLGGSTLPAACGIDPWVSPIRLWLDLTQGRERETSEAMRLGKRLEPVIFAELAERGYPVAHNLSAYHSADRAWLVGRPDGFLKASPTSVVTTGIIEAKATGRGYDECPPHWEAQLQTYLHLAGVSEGVVAQLAGLTLTVWEVERNDVAIDLLLILAERFMGYVRRGEQPPPEGHPDDRDALGERWPEATRGKAVRETREIRDARRELALLLEREKAQKARMEHLRATITGHMRDAETLISLHDEPVAAWRNVTSNRLDTARLKAALPTIYAEYAATTTTRRLTLT